MTAAGVVVPATGDFGEAPPLPRRTVALVGELALGVEGLPSVLMVRRTLVGGLAADGAVPPGDRGDGPPVLLRC